MTGSFVVPTKQIVSPSDLHAFIHSDTYGLVHDFIDDLSKAVEDTSIAPDIPTSHVNAFKGGILIRRTSMSFLAF